MTQRDDCVYDLFIAYAQDDGKWVDGRLRPALGLADERVISQADFRPGAILANEYERAVRSSRYTLLILTPAYLAGPWAAFGGNLAGYLSVQEQQERLIPLLLRPCDLPLHIAFRVHLDCTAEENWETEISHLRTLLETRPPAAREIPCPYPGMVPFKEEDARFFQGRDEEITWILKHLRYHNFLLVVGPSGSGKSSLITAGVMPQLAQSGYYKDRPWLIQQMRPGSAPWQTLAQTIGGDPDQPAAVVANLLTAAGGPGHKLLLILDQFEEVFTQVEPAEQKRFVHALKMLREVEPCALIVALRADFYADLMNSDLWPVDQSQRLDVSPLRGDALRQAIEEPALAAGGVYLDTRLVDALVADAADEFGALPMLQETLVQLWERRDYQFLRYGEYVALGDGGRSGLAVALASHADATVAALTPAQQAIARRIFLRLVQFGEGRPDTRRRQPVSRLRSAGDDPAQFEQTLRRLTDRRLLTLHAGTDGSSEHMVDISHEALFSGWPRLATWITERHAAEQTRRRLEDKAAEWDHLGRKDGGLLDRVLLGQAKQWLATPDAKDVGYSETLAQLIGASEAARRRSMLVTAGLLGAIALAVIAAFAIYAWQLTQRADEKSRGQATAQALQSIAETRAAEAVSAKSTADANQARAWAELARQQLQVDPVASLYLSSQALPSETAPRPYVPEAEFVLREALQTSAERQYLKETDSLREGQVRLDQPEIVVGGQGLHVVGDDLRNSKELAGADQKVEEVAWGDDGQFLSYGGSTVRVWQGDQQRYHHDFGNQVNCAQWRPDKPGEMAVCDSRALYLWPTATDQPEKLYTFESNFNAAQAAPPAVWSPDGAWLAAWDARTALAITNPETSGVVTWTYPTRGAAIVDAAWSSDSRYLVTLSNDATAGVWAIDPKPRLTMTITQTAPQGSETGGLRFVDEERFLTWRGSGETTLRSVKSAQPLRVYNPNAGPMRGLGNGLDQTHFLAFMTEGRFYLWDQETGDRKEFDGHTKPVLSADWYDKRYLATGGADGTVRIWDIATQRELMTLRGHVGTNVPGRADVLAVRWLPDGRLLSAGEDGTLRIWQVLDKNDSVCSGADPRDGYPRCHFDSQAMPGHQAGVTQARWIGDSTIVSADRDGVAQRWNLAAGQSQALPNPGGMRRRAIWSPDGKEVFTYLEPDAPGGNQQPAQLWSADTLTVTARLPASVTWATWSDAGLIVQDADGVLWRVDPTTGALQTPYRGPRGRINDAQAYGNRLAAAGEDGVVYVWDARTGDPLARLPGDGSEVYFVQWSPDGKQLASSSSQVTAWDVGEGKRLWSSSLAGGISASRPAFSPDGRYVAAGIGSRVYVRDTQAATGERTWSDPAHGQPVRGVQWVTAARWDGQGPRLLLLSWGGDGTVRLWDWESRKEIMRLAEAQPISIAAVDSTGARVLVAGDQSLLRVSDVWLNAPRNMLSTAEDRLTRQVTP